MKLVGFVLGVAIAAILGYTMLFFESALRVYQSGELLGSVLIVGFWGSAVITWGLWVLVMRGDLALDVLPGKKFWVYATTTILGVVNHYWVSVVVLDQLFNLALIVPGFLYGFFFIGIPLGTSVLLILQPFRRKTV
jgi:hypothetical protein